MNSSDVQSLLDVRNPLIIDAIVKADSVLSTHKRAGVSVSGGADSDIMVDLIERVRTGSWCDIKYVFFDTGFEYKATKEHLSYLEQRYGIEIVRIKADKTIPICVRRYGQPFISKYVSTQIERLQKYGFCFEDEPADVLNERYPQCTSAIRWWTNSHNGGRSTFDINSNRMLKEFMVENPPTFKISAKCCLYAKKEVSKKFNRQNDSDLICIGVRKAEGGVRSKNPNITCFSHRPNDIDIYRPLFWFSNSDCDAYRHAFELRRSDCYEVWGMKRTGCVGCPFNKNALEELGLSEPYEPNMKKAAQRLFADSYEYTRQFHEYRHIRNFKREISSRDSWARMFDWINESPEWTSIE